MRPKLSEIETQKSSRRDKTIMKENKEPCDRLNEALMQLENASLDPFVLPEDWLEEEAANREQPHIKKLTRISEKILKENREYIFSYPADLLQRISEEAVRVSRDEPGGVNACRINLNVVAQKCCTDVAAKELFKSDKDIPLKRLGSATLAENRVVATSEIDVYLFSSSSVLCRLHSIVTSLSLRSMNKNSLPRLQRETLLPQFVLVKRKLFRSSNSDPLIVVKSVSK